VDEDGTAAVATSLRAAIKSSACVDFGHFAEKIEGQDSHYKFKSPAAMSEAWLADVMADLASAWLRRFYMAKATLPECGGEVQFYGSPSTKRCKLLVEELGGNFKLYFVGRVVACHGEVQGKQNWAQLVMYRVGFYRFGLPIRSCYIFACLSLSLKFRTAASSDLIFRARAH
jgi:hypothetical protein